MKPGADRSYGHFHDFCHFLIAELFYFPQDEGRSEFGGKFPEQPLYGHFGFHSEGYVGSCGVKGHGLGTFEPETVYAQVDTYFIQERRESPVIAEFVEFLEGFEEGFLRDVLSFCGVSQDVRRHPNQAVTMAIH
jgi:hypothetical protein